MLNTHPNADEVASDNISPNDSLSRMAAFAVTNVDWSTKRRSYLDNFLNYALVVIPPDSPSAFARESVQPAILERFNLSLPPSIVQQLLKRAEKRGLVESVNDSALRLTENGKKEVAPIPRTLERLRQEQLELAEELTNWAKRSLSIELDVKAATAMLLGFVETYYCSLMSTNSNDPAHQLKLPSIDPTPAHKVVAGFVASIAVSNEKLFESVANMARGSMMVNALYSPTLVDTTRGFRRTTIYLDTKIVLRALGYEGEPAERSTGEFLGLLKRQGARVGIFEFTLHEIRAVLESVGHKARSGRMWMARPGSVESFFYRIDASSGLIEQHVVRLEAKINALGLEVLPKPPFDNHAHVIDESTVEADLLGENPNYRAAALKHDVDLIAAIVRARRGGARKSLEESRATFVTMNSLVVKTAKKAQNRNGEDWPLVMFESDVAALVWVKEPLEAPNLPKHLLLATSLGLTNPGNHDWALYRTEIERLLASTDISDNDVVLLRQRYEVDRLAFVAPISIETESDKRTRIGKSIQSASEELRAELTEPMRAKAAADTDQIARLKLEKLDAIAQADEARSTSNARLIQLLRPLWRNARLLKAITIGAFILVALAALVLTLIPDYSAAVASWPLGTAILWAVRLIAAAVMLSGGFIGPVFQLGSYWKKTYLVNSLKKLGVSPASAAELGYSIVELK